MFQEPETKSSSVNRAYSGESEISDSAAENIKSDIYQLPNRINSAHNRGVDGELSDSEWPPKLKPDLWHKGIEEVTVNSNNPLTAKDSRVSATIHNMWEL